MASADGEAGEQAGFDEIRDVIEEELRVQIAIGRLEAEDGVKRTASLIADMVWRVFDVRKR